MAISRSGSTLTFTAVNEGVDFMASFGQQLEVVGIFFQGATLTAGNRLLIRGTGTPGSGDILADYLIEGTSDNADLWASRAPEMASGIAIDNNTVAGTWVLTVAVRF